MIEPAILPLFAYGTLTDPEFTGHLLEHPVDSEPALLVGFERVEIPGFSYPTVVEAPGEKVRGLIYRSLSAEDYRRLDAYEGVAEGLYRRVAAEVIAGAPDAGAAPERASVYVPGERTLRRFGSLRLV